MTRAGAAMLLCGVALGCAGSRPKGAPRATLGPTPLQLSVASTMASSVAPLNAEMDAAPSPEAEAPLSDIERALIEESRRFDDPATLYGLRPQQRPAHWKDIRGPGPFPFERVASVRAYTFRMGRFEDLQAETHCDDSVVARDGTFCPSASYPGALLTDAQRDRVLEVIRAESRPNAIIIHNNCEYDPHQAFVFFDRAGTPIAELSVSFDCGKWAVTPGPERLRGAHHGTQGLSTFFALCRELGLGDCLSYFDLRDEGVRYDVLIERGLLVEHHGGVEDLGIDRALGESKTTPLQKRLLCRWAHSQATRWWRAWPVSPLFDSDTRGFRFEDPGLEVVLQTVDECAAKFPRCDVAVGDVERCLSARFARAKRRDHVEPPKSVPEVCTMPPECRWGFEERPTVAPGRE